MIDIKMNTSNKFLLAVIGGGFLILIFGQVILSDLARRSKKDGQQVKRVETQLMEKFAIREKREKIEADYTQYQAYLALQSAPPRQVVEEFLREVERMARDAGVSIVNLNPQNIPEVGAKVTQYNLDLRVECSEDQLLVFFKSVQASKFLIKVDRFSITSKDEQAILLKVEMLLSLSVGQDVSHL